MLANRAIRQYILRVQTDRRSKSVRIVCDDLVSGIVFFIGPVRGSRSVLYMIYNYAMRETTMARKGAPYSGQGDTEEGLVSWSLGHL
jgi:hypothetical protein